MTYDTGNPVPSTDPRDLDDNAQAFDRFLQSTAAAEPDRLGQLRKTWYQMELDAAALVSPNVAALAAAVAAANKGVFFSSDSPVTMGTYTLTAFSRSLGAATDAAAFRTAVGAAQSGANADITSLSALTTPLTVAQGGTGATTSTGTGATVRGTSPKLTTPDIVGTVTNDNAAAGSVGEYISSTVLNAAAVSLTNATVTAITSIVLTPGDWDVEGTVCMKPAGTTTTSNVSGAINNSSTSFPTAPGAGAIASFPFATPAGQNPQFPVGRQRVSVSTTTTIYLLAAATFAVSTMAAFGFIGARRVR